MYPWVGIAVFAVMATVVAVVGVVSVNIAARIKIPLLAVPIAVVSATWCFARFSKRRRRARRRLERLFH
jgi:membrane protein implicated in regulation of membrane protease activity